MTGQASGIGRGFDAAQERICRLTIAAVELATAESEEQVTAALLAHARAVSGADGIAIARREEDRVHYLAEDSVAPLWAGQSFPIDTCLSGTAMLQNRTIRVPDIADDLRVPIDVYAPTFIRSLLVLPVGAVRPHLALGAYWGEAGAIDPAAADLLSRLVAKARLALERIHGCARPLPRRRAA
jgi:hypothetical protein